MKRPKWNKIALPLRHDAEGEPVPIVSDAAIATRGYGDGRLIPLLILDTSTRPDIDELLRAHQTLGPGDATSGWGVRSRFQRRSIRLFIRFTIPSECLILLDFDIGRLGGVADQIIQAECVYIQGGRAGDRLRSTWDRPRVAVEIPSREFRPRWDGMLRKGQIESFRKMGLTRSAAKVAAESFIREWRELGAHRLESEPI